MPWSRITVPSKTRIGICTPKSTGSCARGTRSRRGQQSDRPNGLLGARLQSPGGLLTDLLDPAAIVGIKCAPPEADGARLGADETQPDRGCQCSAAHINRWDLIFCLPGTSVSSWRRNHAHDVALYGRAREQLGKIRWRDSASPGVFPMGCFHTL